MTDLTELIENSEKIILKRPGPAGSVKGSEELAVISGGDEDAFWKMAKAYGEPLLIRVKSGAGMKNFNLEIPEDEIETIKAAPKAAQVQPQYQPQNNTSAQFEIFRMQMEMDKIRSEAQNAQALDVRWLQHQVDELRKENAQIQEKALEQQREAYQKGKQDAEESPITEGFNLKELAPILSNMAQAQKPPPPAPPPEAAPEAIRQMTGEDLKEILSLVLTKSIEPGAAPSLISKFFGDESLRYVKLKRGEIFAEISTDEDLQKLANGETPALLAALNEALA